MIVGVKRFSFGVTNMTSSIAFYRDVVGYKKVVTDFTGMDSMRCRLIGRTVHMRVVILEHEKDGSQVELVQFLPWADRVQHSPRPTTPEAHQWKTIGPIEAAFTANARSAYIELTTRGIEYYCPPTYFSVPPDVHAWHVDSPGVRAGSYSYILDPDEALVELVGSAEGTEFEDFKGVDGISHVAVGVTNYERSLDFYQNTLGFSVLRFYLEGPLELMSAVTGELVPMKLCMLSTEPAEMGKPRQPGVEIVQIMPPYPYLLKGLPPDARWGDLGEMGFALEVKDIDEECRNLAEKGVRFYLDLTDDRLTNTRFAMIADPDDIMVGLFERL